MGSAAKATLSGHGLTVEDLTNIARNPEVAIQVSAEAWARVEASRRIVDDVVTNYRHAKAEDRDRFAVYGVTTGFGEFKNVRLELEQLQLLQENILKSHSVGFGENEDEDDPTNYFPADVVRAAMVLRINTFLLGFSGVRRELVELLVEMVNRGIVPLVPTRGSVGSSGDLCPLAHTFVTLLGHGHYYVVRTSAEVRRGLRGTQKKPANELLTDLKRPGFRLAEKEGLGLTNGAGYSTALLALVVHDAQVLADTADAAAALSLEAICGRVRAFDPRIHEARGMAGQIRSAKNIRSLVNGSKLVGLTQDVQDAYSVRCAPQVHGASRDALHYARNIVEAEMNAATDNPLFFPGDAPSDSGGDSNDPQRNHEPRAFSAGNFHGQPIGLAADFLAIAVAELANISERRTQMLLDAHHNRGLPANLVANGGVNSGLMIAQYTAASLVSENKVLCHPSSVDSIPTSANVEDHVAMATTAARKIRTVINNTRGVLAIELMTATHAVEWRTVDGADSNKIAKRINTPESRVEDTRREELANQLETNFRTRFGSVAATGRAELTGALGAGSRKVYAAVRGVTEPVGTDVFLEPEFRKVRELIASGNVAEIVRGC